MNDFIQSLKGLPSKEKGNLFENLCIKIIKYHPQFSYDKAWLYHNIPELTCKKLGLPKIDKGIDIIAKKHGKYYAVQCKYRSKKDKILYSDLSTFATQIHHHKNIFKGIIMTNSYDIDSEFLEHGYELIAGDFFDNLSEKWFDDINDLEDDIILTTPNTLPGLYHHQKYAIDAAKKYFDDNTQNSSDSYESDDERLDKRAKIISMCGTGKTRILFEISKNFDKVLILVPSLHLLSQIYNTFVLDFGSVNKFLPIGCDFNASEKCIDYVSIPGATTNPEEMIEFLENNDKFVIICTYTSAVKFLSKIKYTYDFIAYDEAHHVAGINCENTKLIDTLIGHKKLFLTATEKISKIKSSDDNSDDFIISMDDVDKFGKCLMRYTLRDAINNNHLCDYRIVCGISTPEILGYNFNTSDNNW